MSRLAVAISIGASLWMPAMASAQAPTPTAPSASPQGKPAVKVEMVPSLFVMNAHAATLQGQTLTLAGVSPASIVFADRPVRAAGHLPTEALLEEWTTGDFAKDAPNATVSVLSKGWRFGSRRRCRAADPASRRRPADLRCARAGG